MSSSNKPSRAARVIARCRELARISDVPGQTTRLFLSPATRDAHTLLEWWFRQAGLETRTDDTGSLHAVLAAAEPGAPTMVLFSHIDTVPNAGAFDGVLGVVLGLAVMELLAGASLPFHLELVAFSEEEGMRFSFPFLSSLAAVGKLSADHLARKDTEGVSVAEAIQAFGLDAGRIGASSLLPAGTYAALEVHIEQGPVLENAAQSLGVVTTIIGQSRLRLSFEGHANHAGTTPMALRRDALVAAAQWIVEVERFASGYKQLVATVGHIEALPGAVNVVPGTVHLTLDVRHPSDNSRHAAVTRLLTKAEHIGNARGVRVRAQHLAEQAAVPMNAALCGGLIAAAEACGHAALPMFSGAGHDAMILAPHVPTAMLFVRSPGGLSHHPDEDVREDDVEAALATALAFLRSLPVPATA